MYIKPENANGRRTEARETLWTVHASNVHTLAAARYALTSTPVFSDPGWRDAASTGVRHVSHAHRQSA